MPRLTYLTGLALLRVAGAFLLTDHLLTPPPGVTERNVRRIKPGMGRAWVERALGGPPTGGGDWIAVSTRGPGQKPTETVGKFSRWEGDVDTVTVYFDWAGRVTDVSSEPTAEVRRRRDLRGRVMGRSQWIINRRQ